MEVTANQSETKTRIDAYSLITDKIIEQLTKGIVPWQKLWNRHPPTNLITKEPYHSINAILLSMEDYVDNYFLTFDEVNNIGGKVTRGSKGHAVIKWEKVEGTTESDQGKDNFRPKYFTVFNISQCEKIPENLLPTKEPELPASNFKLLVDSMPVCPKIKNEGKEAYYEVVDDIIYVPKLKGPKDEQRYYSQLFRQLIHSTGSDSRLGRKGMVEMSELATEPLYSKEDLVADIGLWFLLSAIGFNGQIKFSTEYASGWIAKLRENKKLMVIAAGQAQKAVDYILKAKGKSEESKQPEKR